MGPNEVKLVNGNPHVDARVLDSFQRLQEQLPESAKSKRGADYRITHPFGQHISVLSPFARQR